MLFSEPKIPQAIQRQAMNHPCQFQCSSASRKFLNAARRIAQRVVPGFSALQRAENSSICITFALLGCEPDVSVLFSEPKIPQPTVAPGQSLINEVSVLFSEPKIPQRAERDFYNEMEACVSVLFSEPKIPQFVVRTPALVGDFDVSVLFSEPKIPQSIGTGRTSTTISGFSALQRAENSSMWNGIRSSAQNLSFSALQRAENSSSRRASSTYARQPTFQCSSASRKFLN